MQKSWRKAIAVVTTITLAMTILGAGLASPARAEDPGDPSVIPWEAVPDPGDGGVTDPIAAESPQGWRQDNEYDPLYTEHVDEATADQFAEYWTSMMVAITPELRVQLEELGIAVRAQTEGETGAEVTGMEAYVNSDMDDLSKRVNGTFSDGQQRYLIWYLVEFWYRNVPGFATISGISSSELKEVADHLRVLIFDKTRLTNALKARFGGDDGDSTEVAGAPEVSTATLIDQASAALNQATVGLPLLDAAGLAIVPPDILDLVDRLQDYVPPINQDAVMGQISYAVAEAGAVIANPPASVEDIQGIADAALYDACAQLPGQPRICKTRRPLGTPVGFNLGGTILDDVTVTLALDPTSSVGGIGGRLTATRVVPTAVEYKPTIVTTTLYVDQAKGFIDAGFNGLPAVAQTATVGLDNPAAAIQGDIQLRATVTHTNFGISTDLTLTGGYREVNDNKQPVETTAATVRFNPAPTTLITRLRFVDSRIEAVIDSLDTTPKVTANVSQTSHVAPKDTMNATVVIDSLPKHAQLTLDLLDEVTTVTYAADATIKSVSAVVNKTSTTGKTNVNALLTGVPANVTVNLERAGRVTWNASSRLTSASASRTFTDKLNKVSQIGATVTGVPMKWSFEAMGKPMVIKYDSTEEITKITGTYLDQTKDAKATATVDRVPAGQTTVTVADNGLSYSAPASIPKIVVAARALGFDVGLTLVGIPRTWSATFDDAGLSYQASDNGLDSISATLTNHIGLNRPAGNHATLGIVERNTPSGVVRDIDASLFMTKIKNLTVRTGEPAAMRIAAGGGSPFRAVASVKRTDGVQALVDTTLTPLPKEVNVSIGRTTAITTNQNFDLRASMRYADTTAAFNSLGSVPIIHGVSLRDGVDVADPTKKAYGAELYLTGLPTQVTIGSGSFQMVGFKPKVATLGVDILLDNEAPETIAAYAGLTNLPVGQLINLDFSTSSRPVGENGTENKVLLDTHGVSLGGFTSRVRRGLTGGGLTVSNIPSRIEITSTEMEGQTIVNWAASAVISSVKAEFHHATPTNTMAIAGHVIVTNVPMNWNVVAGRDAGGAGPVLSYTSDRAGMGIEVKANGSLKSGAHSLNADLLFVLSGLSRNLDITATADRVEVTTDSKVGGIAATVSAAYEYNKQGRDTINDGGFISFPYEYRIGVGAAVRNFQLAITGVTSLVLEPGILSKLGGSFDSFKFSWASFAASASAYGSISAKIDWPSPFGSTTILIARISLDFAINNVMFHTYTNTKKPWIGFSQSLLFCSLSVSLNTQPGRRPPVSGTTGVSFTNPVTTAGGHYYIVPNPGGLIPAPFLDVAAFALADPFDVGVSWNLC